MKILYIDCMNGAAGDMLTASLMELLPDQNAFIDKLNKIGIPGVVFEKSSITRYGITGNHMHVLVNGEEEAEVFERNETAQHYDREGYPGHEEHPNCDMHEKKHHTHNEHEAGAGHHPHHHSSLHSIEHIVEELNISDKVKKDIMAVYRIIAEAESKVHGEKVDEIHFHEVGNLDAIADITAVCLAMEELKPDRIIASDMCTGFGEIRCAHGILPVPAPATAEILKGIPIFAGDTKGEMCTPTGAALVKYFAKTFAKMPVMSVEKIGNGMGTKDFGKAGSLRTFLGNNEELTDSIIELSCNVDDMTAEEIGFALNLFISEGALEAFTIPIGMKKNRPGTLITVFCNENQKDKIIRLIFKHTSTIGIRGELKKRYVLSRNIEEIDTEFGKVKVKYSEGYGVVRRKIEHEDLAAIAKENNLSIKEVKDRIEKSSEIN